VLQDYLGRNEPDGPVHFHTAGFYFRRNDYPRAKFHAERARDLGQLIPEPLMRRLENP
jgi:hypothetical protein